MKNTLRLVGLASLCGLSLSSCVVYDPIGGPIAGGYPVAPAATYYSPVPAFSSVAYCNDDYYYNPGYTTYSRPYYSPVSTSFGFFGGGRYLDHCEAPRHYGYSRGSSGWGPSSRGFSASDSGSRSFGASMLRASSSSHSSGFGGSSSSFSRPSMRSSGSSSSGSIRSIRTSPSPRSSAPRASGGSSGSGRSSGMGSFEAGFSKRSSPTAGVASLSSMKKKGH
jgi:hypothetical protein